MSALPLKLVLLGNSGVGKTAIGRRFTTNTFSEFEMSTIHAETMRARINVRSTPVDLAIWDTAGQEVYRALTPQFFRDASLAAVVFSVVDEGSLDGADYWLDRVHEETPSAVRVLVGNKIDRSPRAVEYDSGSGLAEQHGVMYVETSAMTGEGVSSVFEILVETYLNQSVPARAEAQSADEPVMVVLGAPAPLPRCC